MTLEEKFWVRVNRLGPDECWEWTAHRDKWGYGGFKVRQKNVFAHRFSYQLHYGYIPDGLLVCHHCDNPACVNPTHLFAGTSSDNLRDSWQKGRRKGSSRGGVSCRGGKLTPTDVRAIRADQRLHREIAKEYGVSRSAVSLIKEGKTWVHVDCARS